MYHFMRQMLVNIHPKAATMLRGEDKWWAEADKVSASQNRQSSKEETP